MAPLLLTQVGECRIETCGTNLGSAGLTLYSRDQLQRQCVARVPTSDSHRNPADAQEIITAFPRMAQAFSVFFQTQNTFLRFH